MTGVDGPTNAAVGRATVEAYRGEPVLQRAHVAVRWRSCPFDAVLAELPISGRVLEIGCGHGLLALATALSRPDCEVVATDVDEAKLAAGRRAAQRAGVADRLTFATANANELPPGPWSAVTAVDVLYLLPRDAQRDLIARAARALGPRGVVVIKETDTEPRWKARWSRTQEVVAVRILRITEGSSLLFVPAETIAGWMEDAGLAAHHRRVDRGYPHPHHLFVGRAA